eukprot:gene3044-3507_t
MTSNQPWRNESINTHYAYDRNNKGQNDSGNNIHLHEHFPTPAEEQLTHPAFRPDFKHQRQDVYYRELVHENPNFRQQQGSFRPPNRYGYSNPQEFRNQGHFLPPRVAGPSFHHQRFQNNKQRYHNDSRQHYNNKDGWHNSHENNIKRYFKESMLEDPWKEFGMEESCTEKVSCEN